MTKIYVDKCNNCPYLDTVARVNNLAYGVPYCRMDQPLFRMIMNTDKIPLWCKLRVVKK